MMQANFIVMRLEPPANRRRGVAQQIEVASRWIIDRNATCMLPNQIVAPRSHRVGPVHTGLMAVFVSQ